MNYKFSVLSSIYHKEKSEFFDLCMKSIWIEQTLKPDEMILVEDGPLTPCLYQAISYWKNKLGDKLIVISLDKNVGTGRAKNIGLQNCTHEFIFIMDTDDICSPNRFKLQMDFFKHNPSVSILGGQISEFESDPRSQISKRIVPSNHNDIIKFAKIKSPLNNVTIGYKKSKVLEVGGYKHHLFMEDYNLFLRLIANECIFHNLEDTLVYARVDNGVFGRRRGFQYIKSEYQLLKLKKTLQKKTSLTLYLIFIARSTPRLLPEKALNTLYTKLLRNKM